MCADLRIEVQQIDADNEMMNAPLVTLTKEQCDAVNRGETVNLQIDCTPCVLVRQDVYEGARQNADSPREAYPAVLRALDLDDDSPEQYLEYLNE